MYKHTERISAHLLALKDSVGKNKDKIAVWIKWYRDRGKEIQDCVDGDTGSKDMPSWRRVCKMLLKNDYWAKTLCFSPTKSSAYEQYKKVMKKRRQKWEIFK